MLVHEMVNDLYYKYYKIEEPSLIINTDLTYSSNNSESEKTPRIDVMPDIKIEQILSSQII